MTIWTCRRDRGARSCASGAATGARARSAAPSGAVERARPAHRARPAQGRAAARLRRRAGALTVPRRFPAASVAVGRPRVLVESGVVTPARRARVSARLRLVSRDIVTSYATETFAQAWSVWHVPAGEVATIGYYQPPLIALLRSRSRSTPGSRSPLVLMPLVTVLVGAALAGSCTGSWPASASRWFRGRRHRPARPRIPAWVYFTASGLPTMGGCSPCSPASTGSSTGCASATCCGCSSPRRRSRSACWSPTG